MILKNKKYQLQFAKKISLRKLIILSADETLQKMSFTVLH